ncbi:Protein fem-1-like protein [Colletotrichum sojae]|uniref:Protein fem-1-like protein n=1 Tax=Colletotrichum sojae TaxID=2175907 RepID=A0A8H6J9D3_9PEZI|nr:Protein fem-1-like protein [Colletotrichum sojae]
MASTMDNVDILRKLVHFDRLSPDLPETRGPLSAAAACENFEAVQILLEHGEYVNEDNSEVYLGRAPLQAAVETGNLDLTDIFLKAGAEINAPAAWDRGATALQLASITGRLGIARTLIDLGADINAAGADHRGRTALEGAAEHGRIDVVQYLLSQGAWTSGRGRLQYLRAIRYAQLNGHMAVANLLRSHREWTAYDEDTWADLKFLSTEGCELYEDIKWEEYLLFEEDTLQEHERMPSEEGRDARKDAAEVASAEKLDSSRMCDNAGSSQAPTNMTFSTAHLEDLEMLTRNSLEFW